MPRWDVHFDMKVRTGDAKIVERLARAHALASVIRGIPIPPYIQARLDRLNIVRAVRGTTGIEGTELAEGEVEEILTAPEEKRVLSAGRAREEQEVRNAAALMQYVADQLQLTPEAPLNEDLTRTFHRILTSNIDDPRNTPGQYRAFPVSAGTYLPPETGEDVRRLMAEFIQWFNTGLPASWDPILRAVAAHFFIVSIHPFGDGNGRTARAVESYLLYQAGINARGFYSLANYYYRKRPEYVKMLDYVRFQSNGDLTPFIEFALEGLVAELEEVHSEVLAEVSIISFRDLARETLDIHGRLGTSVGLRLLQFLFELDRPVSLKDLRAGKHRLSRLYKDFTTKTLTRDINFLKQCALIVIRDDIIEANVGLMTRLPHPSHPNQGGRRQ